MVILNDLNDNHKELGYNFVSGIWTEGPGLVHNNDGTGIIDGCYAFSE